MKRVQCRTRQTAFLSIYSPVNFPRFLLFFLFINNLPPLHFSFSSSSSSSSTSSVHLAGGDGFLQQIGQRADHRGQGVQAQGNETASVGRVQCFVHHKIHAMRVTRQLEQDDKLLRVDQQTTAAPAAFAPWRAAAPSTLVRARSMHCGHAYHAGQALDQRAQQLGGLRITGGRRHGRGGSGALRGPAHCHARQQE